MVNCLDRPFIKNYMEQFLYRNRTVGIKKT
jgi:hypothetical protein